MKHEVAVIGEGVIDRFISSTGTTDVIGGSPLNTAVALRRAGVDCTWWNRVSRDTAGDSIFEYAVADSVAGEGIIRGDQPSSVVNIQLNETGIPSYKFELDGAVDWQWTISELSEFVTSAPILQIGSLTAVLEPGSSQLLNSLKTAKTTYPNLVISYDPNARPKAANSEAEAEQMRKRILEFVAIANLIKVSDEDLEWIAPEVPPSATAALWSTLGPKLVVMTRGASGASAFSNGVKLADVPGVPTELVDTVGAGDTFMAWLLQGIVRKHEGSIPNRPTQVEALLKVAAKAAAITCSRAGCNPPAALEVLD